MVRILAAKEALDQISSPKFVFLFAVSTILIVFSLYTGSSAYVGARAEYQSTQALSRRELENRRSYQEVSQFGVKVAREPAPLSSLAGGVSSALGRSVRVRPEQQPEFAPPPLADMPVLAVLGELDFGVVTKVFLSLFVLLLTYNAVAGEKESGTLKAVLANPVPRAQFLLGKALGLFGILVAATLVPALLGLLGGRTSQTLRIGGPATEDARLDLSTLPKFTSRPEPFLSSLGRATPDLVIMGLWAAAGMLLAFARFMKYDVR